VSHSWTSRRDEATTPHASVPTLIEGKDYEHEMQFLTEANLTPRSVARFRQVGRQRSHGAPLSAMLLRSSAPGYEQQEPSAADLLASMRAKFNAVPMETQKLADNLTMLSGPGGSVVVSTDVTANSSWTLLLRPLAQAKEALDGLAMLR